MELKEKEDKKGSKSKNMRKASIVLQTQYKTQDALVGDTQRNEQEELHEEEESPYMHNIDTPKENYLQESSTGFNSSQRFMLNNDLLVAQKQMEEEQKHQTKSTNSSWMFGKKAPKAIEEVGEEYLPTDLSQVSKKHKPKATSDVKLTTQPDDVAIELHDNDGYNNNPSPKLEEDEDAQQDDDQKPDIKEELTMCQKAQNIFKLIGCAMSLMNLIGQIVFYMKMEFSSQFLMNSYLGFIIIRILLVILVSGIYIVKNFILHQVNQMKLIRDSNGSPSIGHHFRIRRQGFLMYMHYPFMLLFGFYRIYKPKDFKLLMAIGFFMEFVFQLVPFAYIQATNNSTLKITTLKSIQSYSLAMSALVYFELFIQVLWMMYELRSIKKLKAQGQASTTEYTALCEEDKRKQNYRKTWVISLVGLTIFILAISLCNALMQGRSCAPGQSIHQGVCVNCEDRACNKCSVYNYCEECENGYFQTEGQCYFCDPRGLCQNCNDQQTCSQCIPGTVLLDGKCLTCGDNDGCALCKEDGCQICKKGYYLDLPTQTCIKCSNRMSSCEECTGPKTCTKCFENIAILSKQHTCKCTGLWEEGDTSSSCTCSNYQLASTNECSTCSGIIPGCQECTELNNNRIFGNIEIGTQNNQLGYLRCEDCGGSTMYLDMENVRCKNCSSLTPGCLKCNHLGFGCTECEKGYFINIVSTSIAFECELCSLHLTNCIACANSDKCAECAIGYTLNDKGLCIKK